MKKKKIIKKVATKVAPKKPYDPDNIVFKEKKPTKLELEKQKALAGRLKKFAKQFTKPEWDKLTTHRDFIENLMEDDKKTRLIVLRVLNKTVK